MDEALSLMLSLFTTAAALGMVSSLLGALPVDGALQRSGRTACGLLYVSQLCLLLFELLNEWGIG